MLRPMTPVAIPLLDDFAPKPPDYRRTEWFGRYRLWFEQVAPVVDDYTVLLRVRGSGDGDVRAIFDEFERRFGGWPLRLVCAPRRGPHLACEGTAPGTLFLELEMYSDVCYIDMRNVRRALEAFAPHLHDARFFVFSSGDMPDRWVDEYTIEGGKLVALRHTVDEPYFRRLDYYVTLVPRRDDVFRAFVRFMLAQSREPRHASLLEAMG